MDSSFFLLVLPLPQVGIPRPTISLGGTDFRAPVGRLHNSGFSTCIGVPFPAFIDRWGTQWSALGLLRKTVFQAFGRAADSILSGFLPT